ncbi:hypothetical protein GCM10009558_029500 [Virgisporangium aurantiacum]
MHPVRDKVTGAAVRRTHPPEPGRDRHHDAEHCASDETVLVAPGHDPPGDEPGVRVQGFASGRDPAGPGQAVGVGAGEQRGAVRDRVPEPGVGGRAPPTAQLTPLCGSTISSALTLVNARTTSVVRSSELLSTTSSVKSRSVCAASASSVAVIRAASL